MVISVITATTATKETARITVTMPVMQTIIMTWTTIDDMATFETDIAVWKQDTGPHRNIHIIYKH